VQWHAEMSSTRPLSTIFGLAATYQTDAIRLLRGDGAGRTDHSAYQVHDVALGLPIQLYEINASITPWIGGQVEANSLATKTDAAGAAMLSVEQFGIYAPEPYAKLDLTLGVWNALFFNATLRWGRQPETWDPFRTPFWDASGEANLTTLLSFIDAWPLRDTSLRTYARIDVLHDRSFAYENMMYTLLQEVTVNVLKGGSPYSVVGVTGSATFQHSAKDESYNYYAPPDVLMLGGSLTGSTWIGVGQGDVLGLSLRAYGGTFQERVLGPAPTFRIKGEGQADISFSHGNGTFTLTAVGNATYNTSIDPAIASPWDYWSAFVRLGYTTGLPRLLAP
jgi:hypothetical protein